MTQSSPDAGRRRLLARARDTAAAGAAAALLPAGVAAARPAPPGAPALPAARAQGGYHDTEHTRRYYALARF